MKSRRQRLVILVSLTVAVFLAFLTYSLGRIVAAALVGSGSTKANPLEKMRGNP